MFNSGCPKKSIQAVPEEDTREFTRKNTIILGQLLSLASRKWLLWIVWGDISMKRVLRRCYNHALSDPFWFLSGRFQPIPVTAYFTAITLKRCTSYLSLYKITDVRLKPFKLLLWVFQPETVDCSHATGTARHLNSGCSHGKR
jgi:hypothetical protein